MRITTGQLRTPDWLARVTQAIEHNRLLDPAAALVDKAATPLARDRTGDVLSGKWLGHALHPLLTDLPLGCWLSAEVLDFVGGRKGRPAAQRLVGVGLLLVPPTVAAGLVDAKGLDDERTRRVAAVHGAGNAAVAYLYYRSWRARRRQHHLGGMLFGVAGGALAVAVGYLGGHLSFARGVGQGPRGLHASDEAAGAPDDVLGLDDAARVLDVSREQVLRLVDGDLLVPVADGHGGPRFRRGDLRAVRLVGA
jgi:uncharacterized membrane protein